MQAMNKKQKSNVFHNSQSFLLQYWSRLMRQELKVKKKKKDEKLKPVWLPKDIVIKEEKPWNLI